MKALPIILAFASLTGSVAVNGAIPGKVEQLTALQQADGSVKINWTAPEGASADTKYNLLVNKDRASANTTIATGLSSTGYVYSPALTEPSLLKFIVQATNEDGTGAAVNSPEAVFGPYDELPFNESFNQSESDLFECDHLWAVSTTSQASYPPVWKYAQFTYTNAGQILPVGGEGYLAYITFYDNTPLADYNLTSNRIDLTGEESADFSFNYYRPSQGQSGLTASISYDGQEFTPVFSVDYTTAEEAGWKNVQQTLDVPQGAKYVIIRFTARNLGTEPQPVVIDEVRLKVGSLDKAVYPASAENLEAVYDKAAQEVLITLTAPRLSHPTLGDVNSQPLEKISQIDLYRQIGYDDYTLIHTFDNPTPGQELSFVDTDVAKGGEYRYKAITYIGKYCDYGAYTDQSIIIGQIPVDVNDLTLTSNEGKAPVTITFTLPSKDSDGDALSQIKKAVISRYDESNFVWTDLVALTENLTPGEKVSYQDNDAAEDVVYQYKVTIYGTAGKSYGTTAKIYLGYDTPLRPTAVVARVNEQGKVEVSWQAPTEGENSGYIDVDHLTYTVQRGNGYSDYDAIPLQSGIKGTSFVDPTDYKQEEAVRYFVKARNGNYEGFSGVSELLVVGPASTLPFHESFEAQVGGNIQADHTTWTTTSSETSSSWAFAEMAYFIMEGQAMPVNGGKGLAYVYYGPYNAFERDDHLTSGNIDIETALEPELEFHLYGVPGYDTELHVSASFDGGEFQPVEHFYYNKDIASTGWQKYNLPIEKPAGAKTMKIRFSAHKGANSCSVAIDHITVSDTFQGLNGIESAVSSDAPLFNLQGIEVDPSTASPGIYIQNGKKVRK